MKQTYSITLLFILILLFFVAPEKTSSDDYFFESIYLVLALFLLVIHFKINNKKGAFTIGTIFILGFFIVHFQWSLMIVFSDIIPNHFFNLFSNQIYFTYGLWLSLIALISWLIGFNSFDFSFQKGSKNSVYKGSPIILVMSYCLLILFIYFAGSSFISGAVYKTQGSAEAISGVSAYIHKLLKVLVTILVVLLFYKYSNSQTKPDLKVFIINNLLSIGLVMLYLFLFVIAGDRGEALQVLIAVFLCYNFMIKPISYKYFAIMILCGAFIMTFIGVFRSALDDDVGLELDTVYDLTINLANSNRVLYSSIQAVDENGLYYGKLWIGPLLGPIPFASSAYLSLSEDKVYYISSSGYITYLRYGENSHTGEGSTILADIYLNFGVFGICVFLFILGFITKTLENTIVKGVNVYFLYTAISFGSLAFFSGRAGLFSPLQLVMWGVFILFLTKSYSKKIKTLSNY
ncbi:MAG: oligosaccharide repeat unit polymerase [Mariniflexile sp.]|jgi:oligosaccharide repeat unit polymerase